MEQVRVGRRELLVAGAAGAGALLLPGAAAMAQSKPKVSATLTIDQTQIAFLVSGAYGGGMLHFNGRYYKFTVGGLGVGGIGYSKLQATGNVYGLKRLKDFPGVYGSARIGWAFQDQGSGQLWLQNTSDVVLELRANREGYALTAGVDGVAIQME